MIKIPHKVNIGIMSAICVALVLGSITIFAPEALAQTYPNKPIRFIVPWPPGGTNDVFARIAGPKLAERLGQPVVIENRPGAGGNVGCEIAAKAKSDGYTIVLGTPGALTISPSLYKRLNYDPIKDFAPISLAAQTTYLLVVRSSLPVNSLKELVSHAKANPGKLNYGSAGIGASAQLAAELFKILAKVNITHVPYKGAAQSLVGLMSGEVDMLVIGPGVAMPGIQTGKLRALAVLRNERLHSLPNLPTAKEAGIDNFEVIGWIGLLAPSGTPRDVVNRLNAEWIRIAAMPDTREQLQKAELDQMSGSPEQFSELIKTETMRWAKVIKEANIPRID